MKRAESQVIGTSFFQFHKTADDIDNIDSAKYLLYGIRRDHVHNIRTANISYRLFKEEKNHPAG